MEFGQGIIDEFAAAVRMVFRQVENSTVKKEKRENGIRAFEGVVKSGVVLQPQIAAKPK